jgi:glycosyltransferase involved in cell wall biosynthesis
LSGLYGELDLLHAPSGYLPVGAEKASKIVVTIHDLQQLHMPEFFSGSERDYRFAQIERIKARADHLLCVSTFTRDDVHRRLGVAPERLSVAWPPIDPDLITAPPPNWRARLRRSLGLDGPYAFYPAHPWPHKNHLRLLAVWESLARKLPNGWRLVLTGAPMPQEHPASALLARLQARGSVLHLGYRSPWEMRTLLHEAAFLLFPSEFEGFGLPVAEALLAGVPVACSDAGSLREVAGEAARYFDPRSVAGISDAILELASDPACRAALVAAAKARHHLFDSLGHARGALSAYARVLGDPRLGLECTRPAAIPPTRSRHQRFRHWARRAETAGGTGKMLPLLAFSFIAAWHAPLRAARRLGGAGLCRLEVFLLKLLQR